MRGALTLITLLIAASCIAQPFERVEVVKVDSSRSAQDVYRSAERWFVDTFKDAQEVIQLRDTATHTIVGKGVKKVYYYTTGFAAMTFPYWYHYTVEVGCKAGRYRFRIYDMSVEGADPRYAFPPAELRADSCCFQDCTFPGIGKKLADNNRRATFAMCADIEASREGLIASLKAAMVKPKDDW